MDKLIEIYTTAAGNKFLQLVLIAIVLDTLFGVLRAIKERRFNSNFGINGAIRKCGMLVCLLALVIVDRIAAVNLIGFIPEQVREYMAVDRIGTMEFFAILFVTYEIISILKNMYLCGLPVKKIWQTVKAFLQKYTDELPADEETEGPETLAEVAAQEEGAAK
jgi:toxin secretion/phage lysis holin